MNNWGIWTEGICVVWGVKLYSLTH